MHGHMFGWMKFIAVLFFLDIFDFLDFFSPSPPISLSHVGSNEQVHGNIRPFRQVVIAVLCTHNDYDLYNRLLFWFCLTLQNACKLIASWKWKLSKVCLQPAHASCWIVYRLGFDLNSYTGNWLVFDFV